MKLRQVASAIVILLITRINGNKLTCGERLIDHEALLTNGLLSNEGDWPWHAAIHYVSNNESSYKCGGTLLSPDSILTAAHCVPKGISPDILLIFLGTHNLIASGSSLQKFGAYNIFRHRDYDEDNYLNDIAIIRLSTEATLNNYVQPICLWDSNRLGLSEVINKFGTVIGFGFTESDQQSHILRHAFMPVISHMKCLETHRDFFGARLSETNFCAGFRNGTSVCNGDSGGSMTFEENGVYYIRGIVSVNPSRGGNSNLCDPKHLVIFTDVAQYLPWIGEVAPQVKRIAPRTSTRKRPESRSDVALKTCLQNTFINTNMKLCQLTLILLIFSQIQEQDANNNCGKRVLNHNALITRGFETNEGDWPWHAAIFHRVKFNPKYMCGGTVITTNSVISAAHCLHESGRRIISDKILVELGTHKLFFGTQQFEAYQLIPHPEYNTTNLNNDIAIIRLKTEATFNNYVQPICLWDSRNSDISGRSGIVIGWGKTEDNQPSHILREVSLPVVHHSTCRSSNNDFFSKYLTDKNFCAGFENGANLCNGDSGGSLSFEENGVYYIRGVVSLTSSRKDKDFCNSKDYVIFTDIAQYLTWIEEEVPQLPRPQHTPQPLPRPNFQHQPQPNPPTEMDFAVLPNEQSCSQNADFGLNNFGNTGGFNIPPFMNNHNHHHTSFGWRRKRNVGVEHCCNLCKDNGGCQGYEWTDANGGICRLKSGNGDTIRIIGEGSVSGHGSSGRSSSMHSSSRSIDTNCFGCDSGSSYNEIFFSGSSNIENGNSKPAECWWSGCQPFNWAERGCYPSNQWRQHNIRNCANGNEYYCCSTSRLG